jgi:hypothetical protein
MYDNGKAYNYTQNKDGSVTKGGQWDGKNDFIETAVGDLNKIGSTKQGNTVVSDLESSKYQYGIYKAANLLSTGFKSDDNQPGGGKIFYTQNGGSTPDFSSASSPITLGHELYHGWAYEYSNEPKGDDFGSHLAQETGAVKFENYLRASFGETEMRQYYTLQGAQQKVASSSIEDAKSYSLPHANYMIGVQINYPKLPHDADHVVNRQGVPAYIFIDSRKQKF